MKIKKNFKKFGKCFLGGSKFVFLGLAVLVIIVKGVCPLLLPLLSLLYMSRKHIELEREKNQDKYRISANSFLP